MGVRADYLGTFPYIRELLAAAEPRWSEPSALEGMTIGSLAAHTARSVTLVDRYLSSSREVTGPLLDAADYWTSIPGLGPDLESDTNTAVRERAERNSEAGSVEVLARVDEAAERLSVALDTEPADRAISVLGRRNMLLDDYLVTRLVEIVVHADDLAVSLDVESPPFAHSAMDAVTACLVEVARRTHGRLAVIRALSRRERDVVEALRVL